MTLSQTSACVSVATSLGGSFSRHFLSPHQRRISSTPTSVVATSRARILTSTSSRVAASDARLRISRSSLSRPISARYSSFRRSAPFSKSNPRAGSEIQFGIISPAFLSQAKPTSGRVTNGLPSRHSPKRQEFGWRKPIELSAACSDSAVDSSRSTDLSRAARSGSSEVSLGRRAAIAAWMSSNERVAGTRSSGQTISNFRPRDCRFTNHRGTPAISGGGA